MKQRAKKRLLRISIIIIILISLIFLTSCKKGGSSPRIVDYRTGTRGISMKFLPNAPPTRVYEGNNFNIMVDIENLGAYPKESTGGTFEGYLIFSGPTDAAVNVGSREKSIPADLPGRSYSFPNGGKTTVTFEDPSVEVPGDAERYTAPILMTACYKYQTLASPTICIDPNPYNTVESVKACTVRENVPLSGGQGGPVVVSRIEEYAGEDTATFRITFSNAGPGQVIKENSLQGCITSDLRYDDVDRISVTISSPSLGKPDCTPDPREVVLTNGKGFLTCKFDIGHIGGAAYTEQMRIVMDYGYSEYISTKVDIISID